MFLSGFLLILTHILFYLLFLDSTKAYIGWGK